MIFLNVFCSIIHNFRLFIIAVNSHWVARSFSKSVSLIMYHLWNYHSAGTLHNLSFRLQDDLRRWNKRNAN